MSASSLPENWTRCLSKKFKQCYFFNSITNESSWIHPSLKGPRRHKTSTCSIASTVQPRHRNKNPSWSDSEVSLKVGTNDKKKLSTPGKKLSSKALQKLKLPKSKDKTKEIMKWAENTWSNDIVTGKKESKRINEKLKKKKKKKTYEKDQANNSDLNNDAVVRDANTEIDKRRESDCQSRKSESTSGSVDIYIHKSRYQPYRRNFKCTETSEQQSSAKQRKNSSSEVKGLPSTETRKNPFLSSLKKHEVQITSTQILLQKDEPSLLETSQNFQQPDISDDFHVEEINNSNMFTSSAFKKHESYENDNEPISKQHQFMDNEEDESMDIDNDPQITREISRQIRGFREENVLQRPELPDNQDGREAANLPVYTDPLYIVLDTNVLLGHLKFVQELKDYPIPGIGTPILYIPWIVLQELDSLKDSVKRHHTQVNKDGESKCYQLSRLARQAINVINSCLRMDHPRLKGETAIEAGTTIDGFMEETNDDSIIHAALGLKHRAIHSHIVMFSNDRNLCNKSMVAGIKAFSYQNLMIGLRSLFQSGTVAVRKENFAEYFEEHKIQELISKRRKQADELSCELQCILREGLAKIIEEEMKEAYGDDLWLKIVKIIPPWTLHDVFDLLEKHWIAVFGMIVKRRLVEVVGKLKKTFHDCEGSPGSLEKTKELLNFSLQLFQGFSVRSSYDDMLTKCVTGVRVLLQNCEEFIKQMVPLKQLPDKQSATENQALNVSGPLENSADSATVETLVVNPYEKVMGTFDAIWRTVTHFSALIFYSLDFPSPLIKDIDPNEPKPHPKEALNCLSTLTNCLLTLIQRIQQVIRIPVQNLSDCDQTIIGLLEGIVIFMKEVTKKDCDVQSTELLEFCQDEKTRPALIHGLSQLDRSFAMLQQCTEYHETIMQ